jgi:hypothetical protein
MATIGLTRETPGRGMREPVTTTSSPGAWTEGDSAAHAATGVQMAAADADASQRPKLPSRGKFTPRCARTQQTQTPQLRQDAVAAPHAIAHG